MPPPPSVARVCKVLSAQVEKAKAENPDPDTMQMWVVFGLAEEFADDMAFLAPFVSESEATSAACPKARQGVLDYAKQDSLASVIRQGRDTGALET